MFRFLILCLVVVSAIVGVMSITAYRAAKSVPTFYQQALDFPLDVAQSADELERRVLDIHNEIQCETEWQATFTDEQINSWLAKHLEEQLPELLPSDIQDPRIAIDEGRAHVACRYDVKGISTVLSITLLSYLTPEPNVFAIQLESVRAGLLPIPLQRVIRHLTLAAGRAGLHVRWSQNDGSAVALVSLPVDQQDVRDDVLLETLELRKGALFVAGSVRTADGNPPTAIADQSSGTNHQR